MSALHRCAVRRVKQSRRWYALHDLLQVHEARGVRVEAVKDPVYPGVPVALHNPSTFTVLHPNINQPWRSPNHLSQTMHALSAV